MLRIFIIHYFGKAYLLVCHNDKRVLKSLIVRLNKINQTTYF